MSYCIAKFRYRDISIYRGSTNSEAVSWCWAKYSIKLKCRVRTPNSFLFRSNTCTYSFGLDRCFFRIWAEILWDYSSRYSRHSTPGGGTFIGCSTRQFMDGACPRAPSWPSTYPVFPGGAFWNLSGNNSNSAFNWATLAVLCGECRKSVCRAGKARRVAISYPLQEKLQPTLTRLPVFRPKDNNISQFIVLTANCWCLKKWTPVVALCARNIARHCMSCWIEHREKLTQREETTYK